MTPAIQLGAALADIPTLSPAAGVKAQALLDNKTKPRRSLGRLEELAVWYAQVTDQALPPLPNKAIVVAAADHGVAAAGVSAYPSAVTAQMVANFARGGAAINVLAKTANAKLLVVDAGIQAPIPDLPGVSDRRLRAGTANMLEAPAMTRDQALAMLDYGIHFADQLKSDGVGLLGLGEMGIGNTTAASAMVAALLNLPSGDVTGRGTGLDDAGLKHKIAVIDAALAKHRPEPSDPIDVLSKVGGLEIAFLAGLCLGAAANRLPVVLDGFITGAAALTAAMLAPAIKDYFVASHVSVERGHRYVLAHLGLKPLLDFDLRLGEGTGAALAMPMIDAALAILRDMASFAEAGVSDTGR